MGFQIGLQKEDGSKTVKNDYAGWAYLETDAPLVITMIWLHAAMPRIFRGKSVFSPYLVPPIRHAKYMDAQGLRPRRLNTADEDEQDAPTPAPEREDDPAPVEYTDESPCH